jgi:hypothetical protein
MSILLGILGAPEAIRTPKTVIPGTQLLLHCRSPFLHLYRLAWEAWRSFPKSPLGFRIDLRFTLPTDSGDEQVIFDYVYHVNQVA